MHRMSVEDVGEENRVCLYHGMHRMDDGRHGTYGRRWTG